MPSSQVQRHPAASRPADAVAPGNTRRAARRPRTAARPGSAPDALQRNEAAFDGVDREHQPERHRQRRREAEARRPTRRADAGDVDAMAAAMGQPGDQQREPEPAGKSLAGQRREARSSSSATTLRPLSASAVPDAVSAPSRTIESSPECTFAPRRTARRRTPPDGLDTSPTSLSRLVKTMRGQARITEANVQDMLREVRMALLEADVALPVVRDFVARVKEKALGARGAGLADARPGAGRHRQPRARRDDGRGRRRTSTWRPSRRR